MKKRGSYYLLNQKKECREYIITEGIIKQEEDIDYDVNYYRANCRRCEKVQEINYIKYKPCPIVDFEIIKCKKIKKPVVYEIIDELIEKIESSELINDQDVHQNESSELINDKKVVSSELINDQKVECCEVINDQKDELIENITPAELINDQKDECFELMMT